MTARRTAAIMNDRAAPWPKFRYLNVAVYVNHEKSVVAEPSRLSELGRNRLETGEEEDRRERELAPDMDRDHGAHRKVRAREPLDVAVDRAYAIEEAVNRAEVAMEK